MRRLTQGGGSQHADGTGVDLAPSPRARRGVHVQFTAVCVRKRPGQLLPRAVSGEVKRGLTAVMVRAALSSCEGWARPLRRLGPCEG